MTSDVTTDLVLLIYLAVIGSLIGMPLIVAFRQVRLERRRIMADGTQAPGQITAIKARTNGQAIVNFTFDPTGASKPVTGRQVTSMAAVRQRGLMPGSSVTVHYLPKWARWGFIPALTYVERILEVRPKLFADESGQIEPALFYILFLNQRQRKFRWIGGGDVTVAGQTIRFTAYRRRSFWFPKLEQTDFLRSAIVDVERPMRRWDSQSLRPMAPSDRYSFGPSVHRTRSRLRHSCLILRPRTLRRSLPRAPILLLRLRR
jgi:hypothetical protein